MVDTAGNLRAELDELYGLDDSPLEVMAEALAPLARAFEQLGKAVLEFWQGVWEAVAEWWASVKPHFDRLAAWLTQDMPGVPWPEREWVLRQYAARLNWGRKGRRLSWRRLSRPQRIGAALWWARMRGGYHGR